MEKEAPGGENSQTFAEELSCADFDAKWPTAGNSAPQMHNIAAASAATNARRLFLDDNII